jgi:hypothetical protein
MKNKYTLLITYRSHSNEEVRTIVARTELAAVQEILSHAITSVRVFEGEGSLYRTSTAVRLVND